MNTIDEYIAAAPEEHRDALRRVRETIRQAAPAATEKIGWRMPTFHQKENLIHFACCKNHPGIYPGYAAVAEFAERLAAEGYKASKGAIQFPWRRPLPLKLIAEMTRRRVRAAER